jgi:cell wall-associated NlpC family hydrolase
VEENRVVEVARSWVGVPFQHCGRNRNGVDCVGLILVVARELGISQYETRPYSRQVNSNEMRRELERLCEPIPELEPGAILFLRIRKHPTHLAIYTGNTIIHAYEPPKSVVETTYSGYWEERLEGAYKWRR